MPALARTPSAVWALALGLTLGLTLAGIAASGCETVQYGTESSIGLGANSNSDGTGTGAAGALSSSSASSTTTTKPDTRQIYEVQSGETLIAIAAKLGVTLNDLVSVNNIADPRLIYVGQRLIVPPTPDEAEQPLLTIAPPTNPVLPSVQPTLAPSTTDLLE